MTNAKPTAPADRTDLKTHTTQPAKTTPAEAQANFFKGMTLLAIGFGCIILLAVICDSLTKSKK